MESSQNNERRRINEDFFVSWAIFLLGGLIFSILNYKPEAKFWLILISLVGIIILLGIQNYLYKKGEFDEDED